MPHCSYLLGLNALCLVSWPCRMLCLAQAEELGKKLKFILEKVPSSLAPTLDQTVAIPTFTER